MRIEYIFAIIAIFFLIMWIFLIIIKAKFMSKFEITILCALGFFNYGMLFGTCGAGANGLTAIFVITSTTLLIASIFFVFEKPRFSIRWQLFFTMLAGSAIYATLALTYYRINL